MSRAVDVVLCLACVGIGAFITLNSFRPRSGAPMPLELEVWAGDQARAGGEMVTGVLVIALAIWLAANCVRSWRQ